MMHSLFRVSAQKDAREALRFQFVFLFVLGFGISYFGDRTEWLS
jgi:hypothetical protein